MSDLVLEWLGGDGSSWLLHGRDGSRRRGAEGVILQKPSGLGELPRSRRRTSAARQDGSTPGTRKRDERPVSLKVVVRPVGSDSLDEVVESWRRSWSEPGELWAHSLGWSRWLDLWESNEPVIEHDRDPHKQRVQFETVRAFAPSPFAFSAPHVEDYTVPASGVLMVPIANPADCETYPVFTCSPGEWELPDGVDGASVPLAESSGEIRVDTDPLVETVIEDGRDDGWRLMLGRGFRFAVPAFTRSTDVQIEGPPGGQVRVRVERRWGALW